MERIQLTYITERATPYVKALQKTLEENNIDWIKTVMHTESNDTESRNPNNGTYPGGAGDLYIGAIDFINNIQDSTSFNKRVCKLNFTGINSISNGAVWSMIPIIETNYTTFKRPAAYADTMSTSNGTRFNRVYEIYITENVIAFSFINANNRSQFSNACFVLAKTNNNEIAVITTSAFPEKTNVVTNYYDGTKGDNYITCVTRMSVNDQNCLFTIDPTYPKSDDITLLNPIRVIGSDDYCKDVFFTHSCPFKGQDTYFMLDGVKYLYNGYLAIKC